MKILITGTLGFIGSNFIRWAVNYRPDYQFIGVDKCVASYNLHNQFAHPNYKFYLSDIADQHIMDNIFRIEKPDVIINLAAESFVDDSIKDITPFLHSNVLGVQSLINCSLQFGIKEFIQISTDEVMGHLQIGDRSWTELDIPKPRNPYSASKYCAETIIYAANQTHGLQYKITRCANNYGIRQVSRNLIPKIITCLLQNKSIPIHGQGKQIREWIYVLDHCQAIMNVLEKGNINEIYNIGSGIEYSNLQMVDKIAKLMNITPTINFITDRKGHDFRYSVNCSKLQRLGWRPTVNMDDILLQCIQWYQEHMDWYV